jgi:thiol-disulfide isomerase/thioredoxin|tara:strand:- start:2960 stop:3490 length:531 start_codon:yes stop_codon:yes gene_type:complete
MKLLKFKFILLSIYLLSLSFSYATQELNLNNLLIHKDPKKLGKIKFQNINKETINLSNFKDSLIMINFWATWCAPCKKEMPSLDKLQENKNFNNLKIIPINVGKDDPKKSKLFFDELNIKNLEIYFDKDIKLAKKFLLRGIPTTVIINRNGEEIARIIGSVDFEDKNIINWIKQFD